MNQYYKEILYLIAYSKEKIHGRIRLTLQSIALAVPYFLASTGTDLFEHGILMYFYILFI